MNTDTETSQSSLQAQIWRWLEQVPDPEIPVISVVDLGIVRAVEVAENGVACTVVITPTYSGCPAMKVIASDIVAILQQHGVANVQIDTRLSPAWSTDWMSQHGREQLKNDGIAPPAQQVVDISSISRQHQRAPTVACPRCGSQQTICISQFGSTACKSLYQCKDCLEPFDYFKAH